MMGSYEMVPCSFMALEARLNGICIAIEVQLNEVFVWHRKYD